MEDVGVFYGHLVYFTAIWSILRPFGLFYGHLVCIFLPIWEYRTKKNLATPIDFTNGVPRWIEISPLGKIYQRNPNNI
jgi:hypothetical protein